MAAPITPFRVEVPAATLDDLHHRLERTRFPEQIPGAGWDYGTDLDYLRELVAYWRDGYDWRATEARLNTLEHNTTDLVGQTIHFIHAPSPVPDALPLILTHGWPGSIVEFLDVIEPLRDPAAHGGDAADAFHVVCPSLPGYAFSGPTHERGWHPGRVAEVWAQLMARLGYERYTAQGGDWGAFITSQLALADPDHVAGIHLNMAIPNPGTDDPSTFTADEQAALAGFARMMNGEGGYYRIQSTRPQTLGYALEDSPAGLCAWIIEKFRAWSDCDGDVERSFTKDQLLDNVMLYWVTGTAHSSVRMYYEFVQALGAGALSLGTRISTPTGYARYPKEIMQTSRRWAERDYNLVHFADQPRGGHFAAMEQPDLFVDDVRACFRPRR
jgi:pimeloyl-ACP methyl ester carboxylesterase